MLNGRLSSTMNFWSMEWCLSFVIAMTALQGISDNLLLEFMLIFSFYKLVRNWDDDFEYQVEKRKMSTATAKSEATEN